jgi:hypothetical protein
VTAQQTRIGRFVLQAVDLGLVPQTEMDALADRLDRAKSDRGRRVIAGRWFREQAARVEEKLVNVAQYDAMTNVVYN